MPFKSEKQRRWMWANEPEMAKKWSEEESHTEGDLTERRLREIIREFLTGSPASWRKGGSTYRDSGGGYGYYDDYDDYGYYDNYDYYGDYDYGDDDDGDDDGDDGGDD